MKGLLRKDLYTLKNTFGILSAFMLIYALIGYVDNNASMLVAVVAVVAMMLPANSISYDEFYHWDCYVLTMPVSRKMVVQSKYVLCVLLSCFMLLVGVVFTMLLGGSFIDAFFGTWCVAVLSLIISALALPCMFKWGAQRGRLILVLICGAAGAVLGVIFISVSFGNWGSLTILQILGEMQYSEVFAAGALIAGMFLLTAGITAISYRIACGVYLKKEF